LTTHQASKNRTTICVPLNLHADFVKQVPDENRIVQHGEWYHDLGRRDTNLTKAMLHTHFTSTATLSIMISALTR
jgi:hypothetical protein